LNKPITPNTNINLSITKLLGIIIIVAGTCFGAGSSFYRIINDISDLKKETSDIKRILKSSHHCCNEKIFTEKISSSPEDSRNN